MSLGTVLVACSDDDGGATPPTSPPATTPAPESTPVEPNGRCGDEQVLSSAALDRLHADCTGDVYGSDVGYAIGWFVDRETGRLTDPGAYGSVAWLDLDAGLGGFLVIEADGGTGIRLTAELFEPTITAAGG